MAFHETSFPLDVALGAQGGPERRTDVVLTASGHEERNSRWAESRRRHNAGYGVRSLDDLHAVIAFFEERRGRFHGFRFRDRADWKSCPPLADPRPNDQRIGTGDGQRATFQLVKRYGGDFAPWTRTIAKPVTGSVRVSVGGGELAEGAGFTLDATTGAVTLASPPESGQPVRAGFAFDVPVRFDTDFLNVDLTAFRAGAIPDVPLVEIRP